MGQVRDATDAKATQTCSAAYKCGASPQGGGGQQRNGLSKQEPCRWPQDAEENSDDEDMRGAEGA